MKNTKVSGIDKEKLIKYYKENGNAIKTGKEFGLSGPTVLKIVRSFGVPIKKERKNYTDEYIISKYHKCGTVEKTGIELRISDEKIVTVLDRNNVERKKIKHIQIGNVYNKLTVMEFVGYKVTSGGEKNKIFLCKCECGGTKEVISSKLTCLKKPTKDCGCVWKLKQESAELKRKENEIKKVKKQESKKLKKEKINKLRGPVKKYIIGYKKDRLTITNEEGKGDNRIITAKCECGTVKQYIVPTFIATKSCGCLQKEMSYKNGLFTKKDKEKELMYARYKNMKRRCYNENSDKYYLYGGRGITVCDRWMEPNGMGFVNFCKDMGPRPGPEYSIDRINPDGNYEPSNCRWATPSEQAKNQRRWK